MGMAWYELQNIAQIDSPAVVIYPDRIEDNIQQLKSMINDVSRLRPHVKTSKMAEVVQLMMQAGINKFKCATIAEAEMLGMVGAADVLLAYQPVGPKIFRLLAVVQKYPGTKFSCLVDNEAAAVAIAATFAAQQLTLPVFLDLNAGMNRTGIKPGTPALELYTRLHTLKGITPVGLHVYDGHLHDTDLATRKDKCLQAFEPVNILIAQIKAGGLPVPVIVAGGSPTFPIHAQNEAVECSPGTFVFWDEGYRQHIPEQPFQIAAILVTRVITVIDEHLLCLDLGHKSVAAENPQPRVFFLNVPEAQPVSQSEEHLVVKVKDTSLYPVGTVFYGVPYHICPTIALYEKAYVAKDNICMANWRIIARDRSITV
jgi:D-serine deaminase-like pyridoxal phosphate-dependent protein